jgi:3-deoxy-D-manno-octulosonic-acid transferase
MESEAPAKFGGRALMLHLLYDVAFVAAIVVASPYILYRLATSPRFRAGLVQRLGFVPRRRSDRPGLWIHGVSAGETKTILPLLEKIEARHPDVECLISTTTLAGHQMAQKLFRGKFVFYFPLDIGFIVKRVFRRIRPSFIILMELEIWPNLLYLADKWGAPVVIVNGRISERSYQGYKKWKKFLPEMDRISLFSVQNNEYCDRLLGLDIAASKIKVTGNIKYDGIDTSGTHDAAGIREELRLSSKHRVFVAGSTHGGEEEALLDIYQGLSARHPDLRLVLAPRHIERVDDIVKACQKRNLRSIKRTTMDSEAGLISNNEVLLLDTIGELDRVYAAADLVFVGGSLVPVGGHNMMEPAGKGKPVLFGPHIFNFTEDVALLERNGAAVKVEGPGMLEAWIERLLDDDHEAERLGKAARDAVARAKGATERNFELIENLFLKFRPSKAR